MTTELKRRNRARGPQNRENEYVPGTLYDVPKKIVRTRPTAVKQLVTKLTSRYARAYFALSVRVVTVRMSP
jgi:hypothetical protein